MSDSPGPLFDPSIKPKVSTIKGDPLEHAENIVRAHEQLHLNIQALNNAGILPPTFWERNSGFGVYDAYDRETVIMRDRDTIMAKYFKPEPAQGQGVADLFSDKCEWCGWPLRKDEPCPRVGCKGRRRFE